MLTLIVYEMRKTLQVKLISFALIVILELLLLIGSATGNIAAMGIGFVLLFFFSFLVFFIFGLSAMGSLHRDLSTNQGYMLFMLPKSTSAILLAKILESLISSLCIGGILAVFYLFDIFYFNVDLVKMTDVMQVLWKLTLQNKLGDIVQFLFSILAQYVGMWVFMSCLAILCVTLQATYFKGKTLAYIVTVLLFLILSVIILGEVASLSHSVSGVFSLGAKMDSVVQFILLALVSLFSFGLSAYILEKKRNY